MTFAKLYSYDKNPRGRTAVVVAAYEGLELEIVTSMPHEAAYVAAGFPLGLIPGLDKDGFKLTESVAIATYLATYNNKAALAGATKEEAASVQQWASWANTNLLPALGGWFAPLTGRTAYNKANVDAAKVKVAACAAYLEKELASKTFLVGHRITLADIFVASMLARGFEFVLDAEFRTANPNILRHFNTVANQPEFLASGAPTFIEKAIVYVPPKKEPAAPKAAAAPAAPKVKAPKEVDPEEDEPSVPAEPRAKHPAELLGAAKSFPLDEWKRQYSNNDTDVAMKWLDANFDAQDYSLWKVTYKYPEELTQVFMSANLVGGFHNRLEGSRKYLFGSAGVYGTANDSKIVGAYIIRGSDAKSVFDVAPDYESYDYAPLDFVADRQFIENCWSWTGEFEGKPHADSKVFK